MKKPAFTLIEILLVIGIISVLASIIIIAINPTKQLADARDTQRRSDVNTVLNAVYQYAIDNKGHLPSCIATTSKNICVGGSGCTGVTDGCDLDVLTTTYLVNLPVDPSGALGNDTMYDIVQDTNGRVTVSAPAGENTTVSVTR